jgi:RimJ/RimL family protein N-acetyltransferase
VFRRFFEEALACGGGFAVIDRSSGAIIGSTRFDHYDPLLDEVEIGWTFLARANWGGAYNAEMKRMMLDYAFQFVRSVVFLIGPENRRSRRAVEKIGATFEGVRQREGLPDAVVYRITRPAG